jgi:hypothetical protein
MEYVVVDEAIKAHLDDKKGVELGHWALSERMTEKILALFDTLGDLARSALVFGQHMTAWMSCCH